MHISVSGIRSKMKVSEECHWEMDATVLGLPFSAGSMVPPDKLCIRTTKSDVRDCWLQMPQCVSAGWRMQERQ
jgi:hypothetical protein